VNSALNAITAKIRAMRGRRITPEQYRELLTRKSVEEIASYLLANTRYAETLAGVQVHSVHRGQLEDLIREQRYLEYAKLRRYTPQGSADFFGFFFTPVEIEQIMRMIRLLNDGEPELFELQYPRYIVPYATIDLTAISRSRSFDGLLDALRGTRYAKRLEECRHAAGSAIDYARCDTALFTQYYDGIHDIIEREYTGSTRAELNRVFGVATQLRNMVVLYRVKRYFADTPPDELNRVLLPMRNRTARRELRSLAESRDADAFVDEVKRTGLGRRLQNSDFDYIEHSESQINFELLTRLMYTSEAAPVCFAAYMLLCAIEASNLVKVIESAYYGLSADETMKLLVL
jgi:V/A-type H+-transporting ATPase subunit C